MQTWNTELYQTKHNFVYEFGQDLIPLLAPQAGERILDLGCGSGELTQQIAAKGAIVTGVDSSAAMIDQARKDFAELEFFQADASTFTANEPFDAIFSNATLHWIKNQEQMMKNMVGNLKKGGRWVVEFGGKNNCFGILSTVNDLLKEQQINRHVQSNFYFPSLGEYTSLLESFDFTINAAWYFERPTPLTGDNGIADWLQMFAKTYFEGVEDSRISSLQQEVQNRLKKTHFKEGKWWADYVRLRVVATF